MVSAEIRPAEVVFSDYAPFFEVKAAARLVYDPYFSSTLVPRNVKGWDFSEEEKRSISVMVIRPQQRERLAGFFGGNWSAVGEPFGEAQDLKRIAGLPVIGGRLAHYATQPQNERYQVQIFRRLPDSTRVEPSLAPAP